MAGPIRRILSRRPVRNAVRRLVGMPPIAGQSSALSESRTSNRRAVTGTKPSGEQFRSIGSKSARSDMRGEKIPAIQTSKPQADADAPDVTQDRVFEKSDPKTLNKVQTLTQTDKMQKTDLDAGPRKVGGRNVTDEMYSDSGVKAGIPMAGPTRVNSVEVAVRPTAGAISIRQAREQDAQRADAKRKATDDVFSAGKTPARTAVMGGSDGQDPSQGENQGSPEQAGQRKRGPRLAMPDMAALDQEIETLTAREQQALAQAQAIMANPNFGRDPTLGLQAQHTLAMEEALMAGARKQALIDRKDRMQFTYSKSNAEFELKDLEREDNAEARKTELERTRIQFPAQQTLPMGMKEFGELSQSLGLLQAAKAQSIHDAGMAAANGGAGMTEQQRALLEQDYQRQGASMLIGDRLAAGAIPSMNDPYMMDIARAAVTQHPNDPQKRAAFVGVIASAAMQRAQAAGKPIRDPQRFSQLLVAMIEEKVQGIQADKPSVMSWKFWGFE